MKAPERRYSLPRRLKFEDITGGVNIVGASYISVISKIDGSSRGSMRVLSSSTLCSGARRNRRQYRNIDTPIISASTPRTPPTIAPTGGGDEVEEVELLVVVLDIVGVILAVNVVVMTDGLLRTVSSMRSIVICEVPGFEPRESATF